MRPALLAFAALAACTSVIDDPGVDDTGVVDTGDTDTDTDSDTDGDTLPVDTDVNADEDDGLYHECSGATGGITLEPGNYSGTTDNWNASLEPDCVTAGGPGPEKMFRIDLAADTILSVQFGVQGNDARIYLVDDCASTGTCVDFENTQGTNGTEAIEYQNDTGDTQTLYVVLDTRDQPVAGDAWTLSVGTEQYVPPVVIDAADTCGGLDSIDPITEAETFDVDLDGYTDHLDLSEADQSCTGFSSSGPEGLVPVVVPDGATLQVDYTHPTCDLSLYLLEDCADLDSCLAGSDDAGSGASESISWQNTTGGPATRYVALDAYYDCGPTASTLGSLSVAFDDPPAVGADTCADLSGLSPVSDGAWYVVLGDSTDEVDQAGASESCTGAGTPAADRLVPVRVPDGQTLEAWFTPSSGDAALYLLETCADPDSCLAGTDGDLGTELLRYTNDSGEALDLALALDGADAGDPPASGTLYVEVFEEGDDPSIAVANTCAETALLDSLTEGTHTVALERHENRLDDVAETCVGHDLRGADGLLPVLLYPGETLTATWQTECDEALYLLETCGDDGTCLVGADDDGDANSDNTDDEQVTWTNDGGLVVVYLVLDADGSCHPTRSDPGTLEVAIDPPTPIGAALCADAEALQPVGPGTWQVDLSSAIEELDVTDLDAACGDFDSTDTSNGDDYKIPFSLRDGEQLDITFDPESGDPQLYLVEDCSDIDTCLAGTDAGNPEQLQWHNTTGDVADVFLVIDSDAADQEPEEPQFGFLEVDIHVPLTTLTMGDDCTDADERSLATSGRYEVDLSAHTDQLDLADGSDIPCTDGYQTAGRDGFVRVEVQPGQQLTATWDPSISTSGVTNGSIYLLDTCGDPDACLAGSDYQDPETITWTNAGASPATVYLVVDAWSPSGGPDAGLLDLWLD